MAGQRNDRRFSSRKVQGPALRDEIKRFRPISLVRASCSTRRTVLQRYALSANLFNCSPVLPGAASVSAQEDFFASVVDDSRTIGLDNRQRLDADQAGFLRYASS